MKNYRNVIILVAVLIIAVVTNPGIEKHKAAVEEKTRKDVEAYLSKNETLKSIYDEMGDDMAKEAIQRNKVEVVNLLAFSLTEVNSSFVGFGLFGTVIINADMKYLK